jgi:1,4-alpha-glucan branching enzyme
VRDLNRVYRSEPALWEADNEPRGFAWLEAHDADNNVLAFARFSADGERALVCVENLSPIPRHAYRLGLPRGGGWHEVLNTDSRFYGGSDVGNGDGVRADATPAHGRPFSAELTLPPLGVVWLAPDA